MDKPFLKLTFLLIIGILLSFYFDISIEFISLLLGIAVFVFIINLVKKRDNNIIIIFMIVFLGMLLTGINKNSSLESLLDHRIDLIGRVSKVMYSDENKGKYMVNIIEADNRRVKEKIMLNVVDGGVLELGDCVEFNGVLKLPTENTNPKLFNYRLNLLTHKIHTTMSIKSYSITGIQRENKPLRYRVTQKFTDDINGLFDKHLSPQNSSLISSIILGNSNFLDEEELTLYRDLGLAHILAVSGLHIGIISGCLVFVFSRVGIKRKYNYIITLSIIWFYAILIGYSPSTLRACLMFSILFLSDLIHEPYDSLNTIFISMFILLIFNPFWIFSVSFQLSYIATISIILINPKITQCFYPYKGKLINSLSGIVAVNIGLLPINAYYFNTLPLLGIIANLISVPILSTALIVGMFMVIFNYLFPFINSLLGIVLNLLLNINSMIINFLGDFPFIKLNIFSPDIITILIYYFLLSIILGLIKFNRMEMKIKKFIFCYLLITVLITTIRFNIDDSIEVDFIDVGQGDSILIHTKTSNYLIDTGGSFNEDFDIGKNITMPYLLKNGFNRLDGIIITHFDADHCKGLDAVVENIRVKSIFASYIPEDNRYKLNIIADNNKIVLDKNTILDIIWPKDSMDIDHLSANDKSLVMILSYFNHEILFTGDIEKEVENLLLDSLYPVDILKVAHHGSKTSSTEDFINKIRPKYSIISVGRNNFYNHPNLEVVERLSDSDSIIYRTDEMGQIKIILDRDGIDIIPYVRDRSMDELFNLSIYLLFLLISFVSIKSLNVGKECLRLELY